MIILQEEVKNMHKLMMIVMMSIITFALFILDIKSGALFLGYFSFLYFFLFGEDYKLRFLFIYYLVGFIGFFVFFSIETADLNVYLFIISMILNGGLILEDIRTLITSEINSLNDISLASHSPFYILFSLKRRDDEDKS